MEDTLVAIVSFDSAFAAEAAKALLESEGIPVFLFNAHAATMRPSLGLNGGVKLQVPANQAEKALALLGLRYEAPKTIACPKCGSDRVKALPLDWKKILLAFMSLGLSLLLIPERKIQCASCNSIWEIDFKQ